jgi:hypothetical protein
MSTSLPSRFAVDVPVTVTQNRGSRFKDHHLLQVADVGQGESDNWTFGDQGHIREFRGNSDLYIPGIITGQSKSASEILTQGTQERMSKLGWNVSELSGYRLHQLKFPRGPKLIVSPGTDMPFQPTRLSQTLDGTSCCPWIVADSRASGHSTDGGREASGRAKTTNAVSSTATRDNNPANIGSTAIATITFERNDE